MSGSNHCFLTRIQVTQMTGKVVWYSHLFKNFPQCVVIHTVKGFSIVNKADVFLEFPYFLYDPTNVGNQISGSSAFSKSNLYIQKFSVYILLKPSLKDFEHYLTSMQNKHNVQQFGHALALPFFGTGRKANFFQSFFVLILA